MRTKKKTAKRLRKKRTETVIIIQSTFDAKDTLFPEKVAKAKETLRNTNFNGLI